MTGPVTTSGPPANSGRVLSDIAYRVRKALGTWGTNQEISPRGDWIRVRSRVTRREWKGYGARVVLETELKPGHGWRFYLDPPNADTVQVPSLIPDPDTGELAVWFTIADDPADAPCHPREYAFSTVEQVMSAYAMEYYERDRPKRK